MPGVSVIPRTRPSTSTPLSLQLHPQAFGEHHVERFGAAVGDHVPTTGQSRTRREVHDPAPPPLDHEAGEVVTQPHQYQAIAVQQGLRCRYRVGKERLVIRVAACAVNQHADLDVGRRVDDSLRCIGLGQVDRQRPRLSIGAIANALCHLVEHVLATSDEHDIYTFTSESLGESRPDAVRCTDDNRPWPVLGHEVCGH